MKTKLRPGGEKFVAECCRQLKAQTGKPVDPVDRQAFEKLAGDIQRQIDTLDQFIRLSKQHDSNKSPTENDKITGKASAALATFIIETVQKLEEQRRLAAEIKKAKQNAH